MMRLPAGGREGSAGRQYDDDHFREVTKMV